MRQHTTLCSLPLGRDIHSDDAGDDDDDDPPTETSSQQFLGTALPGIARQPFNQPRRDNPRLRLRVPFVIGRE